MTLNTSSISAAVVADTVAAFKVQHPLVQCLTNIVVAQWTANVLLASGAAPVMVDNPHEAGEFAPAASGVLINTGTPYDDTVAAMLLAAEAASRAGTAWVLDPVAAGALAWRTSVSHDLLKVAHPSIIRGNASEISGLTGGSGGRGVDTSESSSAVVDQAKQLALQHHTVIAVSGEVDYVTDGSRVVEVHNGHPLMTAVTGVGCSLGALMAGFASVTTDHVLAAVSATALLTIAAERAVKTSDRPGSFAVALLDELHTVTADDISGQVKLA